MSALHRQIAAHNRFVGEAARERGAANEARLLGAVLALRAGGASWILDARRATPEEDAAGADVVVTTDAGTLYLQSKSSRTGLAKFAAKARALRVEAVVVALDDAATRDRALVALSALRAEASRPVARPVVVEVRLAVCATTSAKRRARKAAKKKLDLELRAAAMATAEANRVARRHPSRACPLCLRRVTRANSAWRRVEDGACVCDPCSIGLDALVGPAAVHP